MSWSANRTRAAAAAALGVLVAACAASLSAPAQMIYEPFDYGTSSVGTNLANQTGTLPLFTGYTNPMSGRVWTDANTTVGTGTISEVTIGAGNLTPSAAGSQGLAASTGNLAQYDVSSTSSRTARIDLGPGALASGTMYYSMLLRVTDTTNLNAAGGAFMAAFSDEPTTFTPGFNPGSDPGRLQIRLGSDSSHIQVGVKGNSGGAATYDTTQQFNAGPSGADTIFVVVGYTLNPGFNDDVSSIWINPGSTTFGAATPPPPTVSQTGGADIDAAVSFIFRQGNLAIAKAIQVDELRIDRAWSQVTPPAGATWLGGDGDSWSDASKWSTGSSPNGVGQFVNFGAPSGGIVRVTNPRTVGTINLKGPNTYSIGVTGDSTITFDAGPGGTSAINVMAAMEPTGPGTILGCGHFIQAPIRLNNDLELNVAAGQSLQLDLTAGSGRLIKNGAGVLYLSGNPPVNSFSGDLLINNGVLAPINDAVLGNAANKLIFDGGALSSGEVALTLNRDVVIQAVTSGTAGTFGHGTFDTGAPIEVTGSITGPGTLYKTGAGLLTVPNFRSNGLGVLAGTAKIAPNGTSAGVSRLKSLSIAGMTDAWTATLDLTNNAAVIDYDADSPLVTVQNQIKSAYANGSWTGNGIASSTAAGNATSPHKTAIGYGEASVVLGGSGGTFIGQTVDATAVLLRHTYAGDANLDGKVDTLDFNSLAANFGGSSKVWTQADFNYDGVVDTLDFNFLASNFGQQLAGGASTGTLVPEPTIFGLGALAALALCRRCRVQCVSGRGT
jgi:autotransporter-associated beta strand protein